MFGSHARQMLLLLKWSNAVELSCKRREHKTSSLAGSKRSTGSPQNDLLLAQYQLSLPLFVLTDDSAAMPRHSMIISGSLIAVYMVVVVKTG